MGKLCALPAAGLVAVDDCKASIYYPEMTEPQFDTLEKVTNASSHEAITKKTREIFAHVINEKTITSAALIA